MGVAATITADLRQRMEDLARTAGFDLAGVAAVPTDNSDEALLTEERFAAWIAEGRAGEMQWLARPDENGNLLRANLLRAMPWARSVLVCAVNYNSAAPKSIDPASRDAGWIGRYAWSGDAAADGKFAGGSDYHDVLIAQLRQVETQLHSFVMAEAGEEPLQTRSYVDTGPIVERDYAARAGIGWVGRNTCVLNQNQGSWLLLGVIVTSLPLADEAVSLRAADRCGTCTRCVDACPTNALLGDRSMDASLCISYLTIEKKGSIAPELRAPMGRQVFGCDICQDVCPWNRRSPVARGASLTPRAELVNPALSWLASMEGITFNGWFRGSPLERTGRRRLLRNVAIAMGNSGEAEFLPQLRMWAVGDDAVLAEAAAWALDRLGADPSQ